MIQFITTAFTTARFRISVNYVSYSSAVTTTGDVVSRIVDVKGDTITEFTVPYLYQSHWRQVNGHGTISDYLQPRLSIEVLEDIIGQSLESDPTVYVLIWRAAGEDIQFQQLNAPIIPDVGTQETCIRDRFRVPFGGIVQGITGGVEHNFVSSESPQTVKDVLKRFSGNTNSFNTAPYNVTQPTELYGYVANVFNYWRGSRRIRILCTPTTGFQLLSITNQQSATTGYSTISSSNGLAYTYTPTYTQITCEVPWFSTLPYFPCIPAQSSLDLISTAEGAPQDFFSIAGAYGTFVCAGDDFQYGFLVAPPPIPAMRSRKPVFRVKGAPRVSVRSLAGVTSPKPSLRSSGKATRSEDEGLLAAPLSDLLATQHKAT